MKQLFAAAARVETSAATDDLPERVTRAIRREIPAPAPSLFDQIGLLLPRVAMAAAAIVAICVIVESTAAGDLSTDVARLSEQWLFAVN